MVRYEEISADISNVAEKVIAIGNEAIAGKKVADTTVIVGKRFDGSIDVLGIDKKQDRIVDVSKYAEIADYDVADLLNTANTVSHNLVILSIKETGFCN